MKHYIHRNLGVCSAAVSFDLDDDNKLHNVVFDGGCHGKLQAIGKLVEGKDASEIAGILRGNRCGFKDTSCADQLARGIEEALND